MEDFIKTLGALPEYKDVRDYTLKVEKEDFPLDFLIHPCAVKNQGSVGSCVAHSIAEVIEYHNKQQEKTEDIFSVGFIYGNRRNSIYKKSGMYVRDALHNACKYGNVLLEDFNENKEVPEAINLFEQRFNELKEKAYPNRISTYFKVKTKEEIKYALMHYGPVVFAINGYKDMKVDEEGILRSACNRKDKEGGHCMIIYGWTPQGWRIQNSWGKSWGRSGRAIMPYDMKISEAWGVTDEVITGQTNIKRPFFNTTAFRWLAKVINWFLNLGKKH